MNSLDRMIKARAGLLLTAPFFGSLALRLQLLEDETAKTMWTDGITIGYNPLFVNQLNNDDLKGVIAHEVLHVSLNHNTRRGNRDAKEWNEACDYAVNGMLKASGFDLPQGGLFNPAFKDMTAEKIHAELFGNKKKEEQQQTGNGNKPQQGNGKAQPATGKPDLSQAGEVRDFAGTPEQKSEQEQKQKIEATQAANQAEKAGELSGNLKEYIKAINEPLLDWKEVLQRFILQQVQNDYSFKRINTRYISSGFFLPSLYNTELSKILIAIDTSGSINNQDKKQFATELEDIVSQFNVEIEVIYCDTEIRNTESFTVDNLPLVLNFAGGGGTKFAPVMNYIDEMDEKPVCLIYLTDLECREKHFGTEQIETLWIQTRGNIRKPVPFGEVVLLK